eukprot:TCALIF_00958-PA protein Name:"Protein of unknown function" AED:0.30 eAED:0.30 QI:77/1/0/1/1/0.5/2/0/489
MMSFENPIYSNGYFLGFDAWDNINKRYGMTNITYIVRIEFQRQGFKENKIKRHFKRFWLPGANWVERNIRSNHIYRSNITQIKVRNQSQVDLWVYPKCFLRHHGISRIHRVARTMRINVKHIRWLAKVNYGQDEGYGPRELIEIATGMTQVQGILCAWLHPRIESTSSLMIRFSPDGVPSKNFFAISGGYSNWDFLNDEYQVSAIHLLRGWNRALIDFAGGIQCRDPEIDIARRYQALPGVRSVYLDRKDDCRFTYQIVIAFDRKVMNGNSVRQYQHWSSLNHIYGSVSINLKFADDLKAILEFEPGLYTKEQMRAIRDEYLKLPGIRFGWVIGHKAKAISTIVLHFSKAYLDRVPMRNYNFWEALNRRYGTNITILEPSKSRAFIRFPDSRFTDLELKAILRRYRHLPGISSVRMDTEHREPQEAEQFWANSSYLIIPPRRSLLSWVQLSRGDQGFFLKNEAPGDGNTMDNNIIRPSKPWLSQCIHQT